ncbi:hypothetical protein AB751O23_BY_00030 [Chlamydiales bacterium SCGC AB-751-O23]|nr:hypothetical protein AB751O23_BY_00030 [Chlamydiales bacterium SCGC AB-751-O23]
MESIIFWGRFFSAYFILMGLLFLVYRDLFIATIKQMKENYSARFVLALFMWVWGLLILSSLCEFSFSFAGLFTLLGILIIAEGVCMWAHFNIIEACVDSRIFRKCSPIFSVLYIALGAWIYCGLL